MGLALVPLFPGRPSWVDDRDGWRVCVAVHDQWHLRSLAQWKRRLLDASHGDPDAFREQVRRYTRWRQWERAWYFYYRLAPPSDGVIIRSVKARRAEEFVDAIRRYCDTVRRLVTRRELEDSMRPLAAPLEFDDALAILRASGELRPVGHGGSRRYKWEPTDARARRTNGAARQHVRRPRGRARLGPMAAWQVRVAASRGRAVDRLAAAHGLPVSTVQSIVSGEGYNHAPRCYIWGRLLMSPEARVTISFEAKAVVTRDDGTPFHEFGIGPVVHHAIPLTALVKIQRLWLKASQDVVTELLKMGEGHAEKTG